MQYSMIHYSHNNNKQERYIMTTEQKLTKSRQIYDAFNAGFITASECLAKVRLIEREYYLAKYGQFNAQDLI